MAEKAELQTEVWESPAHTLSPRVEETTGKTDVPEKSQGGRTELLRRQNSHRRGGGERRKQGLEGEESFCKRDRVHSRGDGVNGDGGAERSCRGPRSPGLLPGGSPACLGPHEPLVPQYCSLSVLFHNQSSYN